jgi:hypothetical protein
MRQRLVAMLGSPRAPWIIAAIACVLVLPSLTNGIDIDDFLQRYLAQGGHRAGWSDRLDLFAFLPRDTAGRAFYRDLGYIPWFADPELRLTFFRPISALSACLDYNFLAATPWLMHLENVLLYGVLVLVLARLYRRFFTAPVAMLATLLFALDETHAFPVGWLANRNALFATIFGVLAIHAHDRWRRHGWRAGAWLGPLAFAAALLSAEFGLCALGYLVAYALFLDPSPRWGRRATSIAGYLLLLVTWQLVYRSLGYGAHASGWYIDPVAEPARFLAVVPARAALLLASAYSFFPADLAGFATPSMARVLTGVAVAIVLFIAWVLVPRIRRDATLRFFAAGSLLSLVPVLSALPGDRLLFFVGVGSFGVIASFLRHLAMAESPESSRPRRERVLAIVFVIAHLVIAPIAAPLASLGPGVLQRGGWAGIAGVEKLPPPSSDRVLVLVNMSNVWSGMPLIFGADPRRPRRARILTTVQHPVRVTREDARSVLVSLDPRENLSSMLAVFRRATDPLELHDVFDVPGMHVEVTEMSPDGTPRAARFTFEKPLEDASLEWVAWDGHTLAPFTPPAVGTSVIVGGSS